MLLAARNIAKAYLLLGGFVAVFAALGWWLGGFRLASVFFVVFLLMSATLHWYGPRIILASLGARELTLGEGALLHTTVERLAMRAGVRRPSVFLLPDGHPRAFAVGRGSSSSRAITTSRSPRSAPPSMPACAVRPSWPCSRAADTFPGSTTRNGSCRP